MNRDKILIDKIIHGDKHSFNELVDNYKRLVTHIVYTHVKNRYDRDDLCQDVFLKVYVNLHTFRFKSKLSTWIGKIAYNACLNHLHKQRVFVDDPDTHYENTALIKQSISDDRETIQRPDSEIRRKELTSIINQEIQKLPPNYQTVIILFHMDELSYKEISEILNVSIDIVKVTLFRARKMLKEKILGDFRREDIWM